MSHSALSPLGRFCAGSGAAAAMTLAFKPVDVALLRVQAGTAGNVNPLSLIGNVIRHEGLPKLWDGITPALITNSLSWGLFRGLLPKTSQIVSPIMSGMPKPTSPRVKAFLQRFLSAMVAAAATDCVVAPFGTVKTRMYVQRRRLASQHAATSAEQFAHYLSMRHAFSTILREEGFRGFYRGLSMLLVGSIVVGLRFGIAGDMRDRGPQRDGTLETARIAVASKLLSSTLFYPLMVIRTRQRNHRGAEKLSARSALKHAAEGGWADVFRGLVLAGIKQVPGAVVNDVFFMHFSKLLQPLFPA
jgi:hypothetical protein